MIVTSFDSCTPIDAVGAKDGGIIAIAADAAALQIPPVFTLPVRLWLAPLPGISTDAATQPSNDAGTCTDELRSEDVEC